MVLLILVTSQAFIAALHLYRVRLVAGEALFVAGNRVTPGFALVTTLAGWKLIRVGLVTPFAVRMRAWKAARRRCLGRVTLCATVEPRNRRLMRVMTAKATVAFEKRLGSDRSVAFRACFRRRWRVALVTARTAAVSHGRPAQHARHLARVTCGAGRSAIFGFVRRVTGGALRVLAVNLRHGLMAASAIELSRWSHAMRLMALQTSPRMGGPIGLFVTIEADGRHPLEEMRHVATGAPFVRIGR